MIEQELKTALHGALEALPAEKPVFGISPKLKEALSHVQKPGRYTGGEPAAYTKTKGRWTSGSPSVSPTPMRWGCPFWGRRSSTNC